MDSHHWETLVDEVLASLDEHRTDISDDEGLHWEAGLPSLSLEETTDFEEIDQGALAADVPSCFVLGCDQHRSSPGTCALCEDMNATTSPLPQTDMAEPLFPPRTVVPDNTCAQLEAPTTATNQSQHGTPTSMMPRQHGSDQPAPQQETASRPMGISRACEAPTADEMTALADDLGIPPGVNGPDLASWLKENVLWDTCDTKVKLFLTKQAEPLPETLSDLLGMTRKVWTTWVKSNKFTWYYGNMNLKKLITVIRRPTLNLGGVHKFRGKMKAVAKKARGKKGAGKSRRRT
eukprot:m.111249 g.111249  ORF g.111249 m.111249 type:complete len:291 (-) comp10745_c2_seq1:502-1374(-)